MWSLDTSLLRHDEEFSISSENKVNILLAEANHSTIIHDYVGEKGVCLHVWIADSFLIELQPRHTKSTEDHQRREESDYEGQSPGEYGAYEYWHSQSQGSFTYDAYNFGCKAIHLTNVFGDDVSQNSRCLIYAIKPPDMLSQNGLKQCDPQFQGKVLATDTELDLLQECRDTDSQDKQQEHQAPEVPLFDKCITMIFGVDWQGNEEDVSG